MFFIKMVIKNQGTVRVDFTKWFLEGEPFSSLPPPSWPANLFLNVFQLIRFQISNLFSLIRGHGRLNLSIRLTALNSIPYLRIKLTDISDVLK